mmetsp:Transcript_14082/g.44810  ORF Transcript_14082/g.44810 Transcript_14082/m.44810 type:complete len:248 (+) Transcript_14082:858-1601(+)
MDLSLWPADSNQGRVEEAFAEVLQAGNSNLLWDDSDKVWANLAAARGAGGKRCDIIVDNAGFELFADLCLADYLVAAGCAKPLVLQLKAHPTFVSDAMDKDVMHMVTALEASGATHPAAAELGARWRQRIESGEWVLKENFFWVQPMPFWEMPDDVAAELSTSSIVFVKGDANYRRLLGDRHWKLDTPFCDVAGYFPTAVVPLRTLKAELGCGMPKAETDRAAEEDDSWLVNGRYGVVQYCDESYCE